MQLRELLVLGNDKQILTDVRGHLEALDLTISAKQLACIHSAVYSDQATVAEFADMMKELRLRMTDELEDKFFLQVPPDRIKYFTDLDLFGELVSKRFSNSTKDVDEAGKCLGLGRGTAAVFHLMRVMEDSLKYLAGRLTIPYAPSWESYIKQITEQIALKHAHKTVDWKRDEAFFRESSVTLWL
jgi:hypothetical protein